MARQPGRSAEDKERARHPLLVYHNLGKRYRSPGIFYIILGIVLFLPSFVEKLQTEGISPAALAGVGVVFILVGIAFWLFARIAMRRSYVQCAADVLVIRTPIFQRLVSYQRIKQAQSVKVAQAFPKDELKGMGKPLMRPLLSKTAVEVEVKSWPVSKKRLQRFLSPYLFSRRSEAWLFIVPEYSKLIRDLDGAIQRHLEASRAQESASQYEDPIERLRHFGN
ncbi:MAG: hypothetical protein JW966_00885 [Anaerolineae bacterium]|nr:hypothetical protein [Anaerolineae bacterium]